MAWECGTKQGMTSAGKSSGCKHVRPSAMLEGSPECMGVCGKHGKVQQVCRHHRNSMEGAGMHWSVPEYHKAGNAQGSGKC